MVEVNKVSQLTGHKDCVYTLLAGKEEDHFFSGAGDGTVVKWNQSLSGEGELIAKLPHSVYSLCLLVESDMLIVGQNYEGIHLLDHRNKREYASLKTGTSAIFDLKYFGNDLYVATGDGALIIVDLNSWVIRKRIVLSDKSARAIAVNPQLGEIAVGYSDHHIRVFDLSDYRLKDDWVAHSNSVFTVNYSPDMQLLYSGSRDARLKIWAGGTSYLLDEEIVAHTYAINHVIFSPNGKHFVTCSLDKSIKVWDNDSRKLLKVIDKGRYSGHGASVNKLLWTTFNDQLVSASDDHAISVWKLFFKL